MDADDAYAVALMRRHGVTERTVQTLDGISRAFRRYVASAHVDRVLGDGDELLAGGRRWRVHERPGHSPTDTVLAGDGLLLAATTCSSGSPPTRSRTFRSAPPIRPRWPPRRSGRGRC